jgi:sulfur-oxidizing protein SoxX
VSVNFFALLPIIAVLLTGCANAPTEPELDALATEVIRLSFRDQGIAKLDRLVQEDANRACSAADVAGVPLDAKAAQLIEAASLKSVKLPGDGKYIGDWKEGEKIAQSGRGLTWTDSATEPNGGNCYNCHQIGKAELSYGTLGPSLYQYGKLRGVSDLLSPQARAIVDYTWAKIWNARAFGACSSMPRFGHNVILTESQIRHVMALLLDPKSPVNQ